MADETESDETRTSSKDQFYQIKWKLRSIEKWKQEIDAERKQERKELETRIRELEDFKLSVKVTHRNLATWITIAASAFSGAIALLEHLLFK
jgi:DNA repair exonuclease SbcCD ATPase subunit